jgi:hypothetical protein
MKNYKICQIKKSKNILLTQSRKKSNKFTEIFETVIRHS